ncbi:hypothetical protein KFL_001310040 [Klebsormidium nitens]|uniref:MYND-type domain-containing protein n=1 Tax=Klebsormidium nitens TaxID=105231 RepID=A0A1Y1HZ10_KLENI|nr:hypothetical protein KFL_001310040 [Klebsormidium nitens]|eukprot:GAQ82972.1 hypothetical protein KFL_001310040 [Klebsormidium nitens]
MASSAQVPASSPASRFVKAVEEGKPWIAVDDLCHLLDPINPGNGFSEQDWKVAELKSTKAFRKVLRFVNDDDAVRALLSVLTSSHRGSHADCIKLLWCISGLSLVPKFAKQLTDCGAADALANICPHHLGLSQPGLLSAAEWERGEFFPVTRLYLELIEFLLKNSPGFAAGAFEHRLFSRLMRLSVLDPHLLPRLSPKAVGAGVAYAQRLLHTFFVFFEVKLTNQVLAEVTLSELGTWLDRHWAFTAVVQRILPPTEAKSFVTFAGTTIYFTLTLLCSRNEERELFTPAQLARVRGRVERCLELQGPPGKPEFREMVEDCLRMMDTGQMNQPSPFDTSNFFTPPAPGEPSRQARAHRLLASLGPSASHKKGRLRELVDVVVSSKWVHSDGEELTRGGALWTLFRLLETDVAKLERQRARPGPSRTGLVLRAMSSILGVGTELLLRSALFRTESPDGLEGFGPRLLEWALPTFESLAPINRADVLQVLFASFQTFPRAKWAARHKLVGLPLRVLQEPVENFIFGRLVWMCLASLVLFLPDYNPQVVAQMDACERTFLRRGALMAAGDEYRALIDTLAAEIDGGRATWPPEARAGDVTVEAIRVFNRATLRKVDHKSACCEAATVFLSTFRDPAVLEQCLLPAVEAVIPLVRKTHGEFAEGVWDGGVHLGPSPVEDDPLETSLRAGLSLKHGLRLAEAIFERAAEAKLEVGERTLWRVRTEALQTLTSVLGLLLTSHRAHPSERAPFLRKVGEAGGVELTAEILRKEPRVRLALATCHRDNNATLLKEWVPGMLELARDLWDELAAEFWFLECSNKKCERDMVETVRKTFKRCSGCQKAQYCSKDCQLRHWKHGHKADCRKVAQSAAPGN